MVQHEGLIAVLLDTTARVDERDDAAMDLGFFDTPDVEQALGLIGSDESAPETVQASAASRWDRFGAIAGRRMLRSMKPSPLSQKEKLRRDS